MLIFIEKYHNFFFVFSESEQSEISRAEYTVTLGAQWFGTTGMQVRIGAWRGSVLCQVVQRWQRVLQIRA